MEDMMEQWRGHRIELINNDWFYCDNNQPVQGNERPCGFCDKKNTTEGHDGCIGTLPGVMNACCGHGVTEDAYIQFWDGRVIRNRTL